MTILCKMKESGTAFRDENNAGSSRNTLQKEYITVGTPFNFVSRAKQILKEVEEKRVNLNSSVTYDSHFHKTAELYSMVDALVENEDALEVVRIKKLVRDSIEATEYEIQEYVKVQLSNDNKPQVVSPKKQMNDEKSSNIKNGSNTSVPHSTATYSQKKKIETSRGKISTSRMPVAARNKKKNSVLSVIAEEPSKTSKHESSVADTSFRSMKPDREELYLKHIYGRRVLEKLKIRNSLGSSENAGKNVSCKVCGYAADTQSKSERAAKQNSNAKKNTDIASTTHFNWEIISRYPEQEGKYFPCAVPLAPPNRQKISERVIESVETINLPSQDSQPKLMQQSNIALIEVVADQPIEKQLTSQVLPSVDIIGRPTIPSTMRNNAKIITVDTVDKPDLDMDSKYPGYHFHLSLPAVSPPELQRDVIMSNGNKVSQLLNGTYDSDSRVNPFMIAQIVQSVHTSYDQPGPSTKQETEISRELVENLLVELVHENLQKMKQSSNDNIKSKPVKENIIIEKEKAVEKADKETQSNVEPIVIPIELVSEYVQVSPLPSSVNNSESSERLEFYEHQNEKISLSSDIESRESAVEIDIHPKSLNTSPEQLQATSSASPKHQNISSEPPSVKGQAKTTLSPDTETTIVDQEAELPIYIPSVPEETAKPLVPEKTAAPLVPEETAPPLVPEETAVSLVPEETAVSLVPEETAVSLVPEKTAVLLVPEKPAPMVPEETAAPLSTPASHSVSSPSTPVFVDKQDQQELDLLPERDTSPGIEKKDVAVQLSPITTSATNTTLSAITNISDSEFMEDLLSEGECFLPRSQKLLPLSLVTAGPSTSKVNYEIDMNVESGKEKSSEYSLSEGEVHPKYHNPTYLALKKLSKDHLAETISGQFSKYSSLKYIHKNLSSSSLSTSHELTTPDLSEGQINLAVSTIAVNCEGFSDEPFSSADEDHVFSEGEVGPVREQNLASEDKSSIFNMLDALSNYQSHQSSSLGFIYSQNVCPKEQYPLADAQNNSANFTYNEPAFSESLQASVFNPISSQEIALAQSVVNPISYQVKESFPEMNQSNLPPSLHFQSGILQSSWNTGIACQANDASKEDELHYYHRLLASQTIDQGQSHNLHISLDEEPVKDISSSPSEEQVPADYC